MPKLPEEKQPARSIHADPNAGPETSPHWLFARAVAADGAPELARPEISSYEGRLFPYDLRFFPSKDVMYAAGAEGLLEGWLPAEPLIREDTRVVALGSCFAALFVQWLAERGFNRQFHADPESSFVWSRLETPLVVAQQFRWAFGEFDPDLAFWFGPDKQPYEATERRRLRLRTTLAEADVVIITLGLAETWFDAESGEAIWRVPPPEYLGDRYRFRVATTAESVAALETIERIRQAHMPQAKVIYTASPIRFSATFRPMSPIVANVASKAVVRAAIDEFLTKHPELVGGVYHYFPSYEMVTELFVDPYEDNRHPHRHHSDAILELFARHYTTIKPISAPTPLPTSAVDELHKTTVNLELRNTNLHRVNQERLQVIEELETACAERLRVIEALESACAERLRVIEELDAELQRVRALTTGD